jgi:hypothetical protein
MFFKAAVASGPELLGHKVFEWGMGLFIIPNWDMEGNVMPDVSQKEVGRRLYHVHREKRVEEAIKKIRHGVGADWGSFTLEDIDLLGHLLQCTWNTIDQKTWDSLLFANMNKNDVRKILSFGGGVSPGNNPSTEAVAEIKKILLSFK